MTEEEKLKEWLSLPKICAQENLHREVMIALIRGDGLDFSAYIFPVPGISPNDEVVLWQTRGNKTQYNIAYYLFPGAINMMEQMGAKWRE